MTDSTKMGTVYVLVDPRDDRVRYVGATTKTLEVRLQGHLSRAASRVKAWIEGLSAEGLVPRIEAVEGGVPESRLRDREREEITRRLGIGEPLLNEAATVQGRKHAERRRKAEQAERERAAWEHVAHQVRSVTAGPLAPGDVPLVPLSPQTVAAYQFLMRTTEGAEAPASADLHRQLMMDHRTRTVRIEAADVLWWSVRPIWGHLRGITGERLDDVLAGRVCALFDECWTDLQDASRYLALLPWGIVAVGPWAALAERAGMDATGSEFIDWVSDDPTVREALHVLLLRAGGRMGPLSVLDDSDGGLRPSTGLVALAAAHSSGFELPSALNAQVREFLESMLRGRELTPAMGELLCNLDPRALDRLFGPDVAADTDAELGLPPGTSRDVLASVLEKSAAPRADRLDRIVSRANGKFPSVETPDFKRLAGDTGPTLQAIAASLMASGILPAPSGKTPADVVGEVRALWRGDLSRLEQVA